MVKSGVEGKEDDFYTIYHKREYNNKNQIVNVSCEHDTEQLSGENKYLDRVDYEYEDEIDGELIKLTYKNIGEENKTTDNLERISSISKFNGAFKRTFSYLQNNTGNKRITTNLVSEEEFFVDNQASQNIPYVYDSLNRLINVMQSSIIIKKYTYDGLGGLSREKSILLRLQSLRKPFKIFFVPFC